MMRDDALDQLRRENPVTDEVPTVPLETLLQRIEQEPAATTSGSTYALTRPPSGRRAGRLILPALASLAAIAIAVLALTTFRDRAAHSSATPAAAIRGRQQLIDTLAVLRRPQTKADLDPRLLRMLSRFDGHPVPFALGRAPDIPLIRLATTTPWGEQVFLVPMKPPTAAELRRYLPGLARRQRQLRGLDQEALAVFEIVPGGGGGGTCCLTAASIASLNGGPGTEGMPALQGGGDYTLWFEVVPDQVAKIVFILPRQGNRIGPGTPTYKHTVTVTAYAHGNVVVAQVDRQCCTGPIASTWYGTGGQILKRVGSAAAANRIVRVPKPTPPTALSRAAERDPSTPNRVWVTPAVGGPHTRFKVHFRQLLTGAFYRYTYTGTHCSGVPYSSGSISAGPYAVRGQLWTDPVSPGGGRSLCPGTYHVSVTVTSLGIGRGPLRPPAQPFGSATLTVRP